MAVDVTFEPSKLGEAHDTLTVSSAEGGEFLCCAPRQRAQAEAAGADRDQGRRLGERITFKNVFAANADFTFTAEPAVFSVAKPRETIPGKKTTQVAVAHKPDGADAKPATISARSRRSAPTRANGSTISAARAEVRTRAERLG